MNYYEHHIGDYDQATAHLTACEDGIYSRMIRWYMASEGPLPADVKAIQRRVRAHTRDEKAAVVTVLREFFELRETGYHQHRCDEEVSRFQDKQDKARRSAQARWNKTEDASERNANAYANASTEHGHEHSERYAPRARPQTPDTSLTPETSCTPDGILSEPAPAAVGTPAGRAAAALSRTGLRITSQNPNLIAACAEGVTVDALLEVRAMYPDKPAGYVIQAARSIHAERATATPRAGPTQPHTTGPTSKVGNAIAVLESMKSHGNHPEQHEPDGLDLRRDPAGPAATFLPGPRSAARG
ncbi:YdaU family protein [Pseudoxanthomonas mexicana]|uniref:YdaU family protein n=1 Tax=Pseudoxanthomonas mexicana TaxID=128785 RepID=UPI0028AC18B4|nr:YdaU family protein [Pseudoxanthomonas mexicana]